MPTTVNAEQVRALTHLNDANSADREAPRGISEAGGASIEAARRAERLNAEVEFYREALRRIVEVTSAAAQGNLEARLLGCDDSEKLREVAQSVNHLLDMTDAFLREAGAALEHASHGKFFRRVLLRGMRGTFRDKSQLINAATAKMSSNAASMKEVERLISDSASIAQGAVREADNTIGVVNELGHASERIGQVVKSISQLAWQTKLLAFNAKIEAIRAGDAGRGFDIVAQEVKELAQQTATATENISKEITAMHGEVERTALAITAMSKTVSQMQEISATIERSVLKQDPPGLE